MSAQSPETQLKIMEWREKSRQGTLTIDEMREAIALLRKDRGAVAQATAGSKVTKARATAAKKPSGDDLLNQIDLL